MEKVLKWRKYFRVERTYEEKVLNGEKLFKGKNYLRGEST